MISSPVDEKLCFEFMTDVTKKRNDFCCLLLLLLGSYKIESPRLKY